MRAPAVTGTILALAVVSCACAFASARTMVIYNAERRASPGRNLTLYDIDARYYQADALEGFAADLAEAQLLYFGQYSSGAADVNVFTDAALCQAIRDFLARGGVVIFDYNGYSGDSSGKFLKSLGLTPPPRIEGEYCDGQLSPGAQHRILAEPHAISGEVPGAYAWWPQWGEQFTPLMCKQGEPDKAITLVADGVAGKGTIVLTRAYGIFRDEDSPQTAKLLFENLLTLAFGTLPGPGETVPIFDPYERREPCPNPCWLARAGAAEWRLPQATARVPVLVGEPVGLQRRDRPVSIALRPPAGGPARAFTYGGYELPCQTRDAGEGVVEVLVAMDLAPWQQTLLYLYFGGGPSEAEPPMLSLRQAADGFRLHNDRLRVTLHSSRPVITTIAPLGARTKTELAHWEGIDDGRANSLRFRPEDETWQAAVVEDGPLAKAVVYTSAELKITYTLLAGAEEVFWRAESATVTGLSRFTGWMPGGDGTHDSMWYESAEGLKCAPLLTGSFYRPFDDIRRFLKEGWLAFEDDRGEVVGEFLDLEQVGKVTPYVHQAHGQVIPVSTKLIDGQAQGALVAARGDHNSVREAYLAWKNPPGVLLSAAQTPADVPAPKLPVFGRDFLCIHGDYHWFRATVNVDDPAELARRFIARTIERGGNYIIVDDRYSEEMPILIAEAHRHGVMVIIAPRAFLKEIDSKCPYKHHDAYVAAAESAMRLGADGCYLVDEFQFEGNCDACRAAFREKYSMDIPDEVDWHRLAEPAMHNWMLWKMQVINDLIRDMTAAARRVKPDAFVFHVTSPNNHFRLEGYHDLESHSQWVTSNNSDLYSPELDHTRYMLTYIRGAQGNDRPVYTVNGCMYDADDVAVNLRHHLMAGSNALWYFALTFERPYPEVTRANDEGFRLLRDTGLGEVLAAARPVRYAAVLRSRAGWLDCVTRGEKSGNLVDYEERIHRRVLLRNLPVEVLFTRHLTREALDHYRLLIMPSGRELEPESAALIADWVRAGGTVLVEGETATNPTIAELCGVTVGERMNGPADLAGEAAPLAGVTAQVSSSYVAATATAQVLATIGEQPGLTMRQVGQGRAMWLALLDAPDDIIEPLVRDLAGAPPLVVPDEVARDIDVAALSDGARTVVAVHNRGVREAHSFELRLAGVPVAEGARLVDLDRGTQRDLGDTIQVQVPAGAVNFYLIANEAGYALPAGAAPQAIRPIQSSLRPGTEFLRLQPRPERVERPQKKDPSKVYVAVLRNLRQPLDGLDLGGEAMVQRLAQQDDLVVEWIEDIHAVDLGRYEVLIVPNMDSEPAPNLSEGWEAEVREFVESGGGALLVHHSVGYMPTSHPVFPEVAEADGYVAITAMRVAADHDVATGGALRRRHPEKAADPAFGAYFDVTRMAAGDQFQSGFADYIKLVPGAGGTVVVSSERVGNAGGDATVVTGEVGSGRVVLSGMNIGCHTVREEGKFRYLEELSREEAAVLVNSVYWLGEKKGGGRAAWTLFGLSWLGRIHVIWPLRGDQLPRRVVAHHGHMVLRADGDDIARVARACPQVRSTAPLRQEGPPPAGRESSITPTDTEGD